MKKLITVIAILSLTACATPAQRAAKLQLKHDRICMKYQAKIMMKTDMTNPIAAANIKEAMANMGCSL